MATAKTKSNEPTSFEQAIAELDDLVDQMERGDLPLEASLVAYQRGAQLVKYCQAQLDKTQTQIKIIENDMAKPFDIEQGQAEL